MRKLLLMFFFLHVLGTFLVVDSTIGAPIPMPPSILAVDGVINPTEPPPTEPTPTPLPPTNPPSTSGGNFSHIDTFDFGGRVMTGWGASDIAAYCAKIDYTEDVFGASPYLKQNCPNLKTWRYSIEHTQMQTGWPWDPMSAAGAWGEAPDESYYLHLSNNTVLNFADGSSANITGCPAPGPVTKSCRMQVFMYADKRWVYNVANQNWRTWQADRLISVIGTRFDGTWIDEHLPGFRDALYMVHNWGGAQTTVVSGGTIREYGLNINAANLPGKYHNQLDQNYNNDMASWFAYLKGRLSAVGKWFMPNPATQWGHELERDLALASGGVDYEIVHYPDYWYDFNQFQSYVNLIKDVRGINGSKQDLFGNPGYYGPSGYTAGNYDSARHRYIMWRLAAYYLVRGAPGSPGTVYFNPDLYNLIRDGGPTAWQQDWLQAFEYNIGYPLGDETVTTSSAGCSGTYGIWSRNFSNGKVFVRPGNSSSCGSNWEAGTTITVSPAMKRLNSNGTFSAYSTTFTLRNAEALILSN